MIKPTKEFSITIIETKVYSCRKFRSEDLVKNGINASGSSQYHCKACGASGILERKECATEEKKELIINGLLSAWLKEQANDLPPLEETLQPVECKKIPVLEVESSPLPTVIAPKNTCRILWDRVPPAYKEAIVFSD